MKMNDCFMFFSYQNLIAYSKEENRKYDLLFFLIFIVQVFILTSVPSGSRSLDPEEWLGFAFSTVFCLVFYPAIYWFFYRKEKNNFIREIVIFSAVVRLHAFVFTGLIAIIQMGLWSLIKLERLSYSSLIYYMVYYLIFTLLMVKIVKNGTK